MYYMERCTWVSTYADTSRYTYLYVPTCVHVCTHTFRVHALNTPLKTIKMLTELFLAGDPKFTDDHPIAVMQMGKLQGMVSKAGGGRSEGTTITPNLTASPQEHWDAQRKALLVLSSCCCGRCSLLQSALIHSVEDQKEGGKKENMRKATCRGRWWGENRKFFSRAV